MKTTHHRRHLSSIFQRHPFAQWSLILLLFLGGPSCSSRQQPQVLENSYLRIELSADRPLIHSYTFKPTGTLFRGDDASTGWVVNGHLYPWSEWKITPGKQNAGPQDSAGTGENNNTCFYSLSLPALNISFDYTLQLQKEGLHISLSHIADPAAQLKSLSWGDSSLLNATGDSLHWYGLQSALSTPFERTKTKNRGLWSYQENRGSIRDTIPAMSTVDACIWMPGKVVAGITCNTDVFPVRLTGIPGQRVSLGLNTWYHTIQGQLMPDLSADLLFAGDINGDGSISDHDYFRWKNSNLSDIPDWIRGSISYKIFNDAPTLKTPNTTLEELDKIVAAIHNITDGLPQIVYLTGWQFRGHDTGYPSFDQWNERLRPHEGVYQRAAAYPDLYNANLSYHINIDDAYRANKGFDPALMATDFDGGPMFWEAFHSDSAFHASHYKDVRSGAIFKRLEALLQTVPVKRILHIDAMRTINCNPDWEKDSIGVREELELGLKPIMRWLKNKGIDVTTEGQNGNPHELMGLVAGVYHLDDPTEATLMVHHRKLVGGGFNDGRGRFECGIGTNFQQDLAYNNFDNSVCFTKDWKMIKERIYLGSLLYIYYQQRQLLDATKTVDQWKLQFDDSTLTTIDTKNNHLLVTRGSLVIARDDDRFIPLGDAIYAFSKEGSRTDWTLPASFAGKSLDVFSLLPSGRGPAPAFKIAGNKLQLSLPAGTPVKITIKE